MDRDNRWERVQQAYDLMTELKGFSAKTSAEAIDVAYARNEDDEFVKATVVAGAEPIKDNDSLIFFNFRPDRAREISRTFIDPKFSGFKRTVVPKVHFVCLTPYDETFVAPIAFPKDDIRHTLAETISQHGLKQLHTAETEKYAHVTFFFNGGREDPFPGEDRLMVASPKVATYDLQPEMSAFSVTEKVIEAIALNKYDVIILNFANADMVGHTGVFAAAVKAVEAVDTCVGKIVAAVQERGGELLITADHGNSDQMLEHGEVWTAHSMNKVPLIYVTNKKHVKLKEGVLADIAATCLDVLKIEKPKEFTQSTLIEHGGK
jgi:2,3-bisphosphoglycerate-independent phosphoglycerate mutase